MSQSTTPASVLIVGAGPVGLVSALLLLRNGLSVRIIAKETSFRVGYRGPGVQPRTLELYKFLNILNDIHAASGPGQSIHRYSAPEVPGEKPFVTNFSDPSEIGDASKPYFNHRDIGQAHHEAVLRARLLSDYGCQVELGTELIGLEQRPGSDEVVAHLRISKSASDAGEETTTTCKWLIGADGAHSIVRKHLGCSFVGESFKSVGMLMGDIRLDKKSSWETNYIKCWGTIGRRMLVLRPYRARDFQDPKDSDEDAAQFMYMDLPSSEEGGSKPDDDSVLSELAADRNKLIDAFHRISGRKDLEFGEVISAAVWRPNIRMVDKLGEGRVFIAGDAAHVHSPTGGQGLNSGIHDAFNLAWKLTLVHKNLAPHSLLDSYTTERIRVIASMLDKTTILYNQTFNTTSSNEAIPWARGSELRQYGINYRGSRIILDRIRDLPPPELLDPYKMHMDERVRAGDRAPDAPGLQLTSVPESARTSLFDIFNTTYHTALVFTGGSTPDAQQKVVASLSRYPKGLVKTVLIRSRAESQSQNEYKSTSGEEGATEAQTSVVDVEGYAYCHYVVEESGLESPTLVVVRPDGHVGAMVSGGSEVLDGVEAYFGNVFI